MSANNIQQVKESLKRMSDTAYQNMIQSSKGKALIAKADEYLIPYDESNIDFLELTDLIEEYEHLLDEADAFGIEWDLSIYDVIGLQQEIEEHKLEESKSQRSLYQDLYSSRI